MNTSRLRIVGSAILLAAGTILAVPTFAQETFSLSDLQVNPALSDMAGGDFEMESTKLGDGDIQATGGDFSMEGTVTPISITISLGDAKLLVARTSDRLVLTWPNTAGNYILESSTALGPAAVWSPVQPSPAEETFSTPLTEKTLFFRLRRQ